MPPKTKAPAAQGKSAITSFFKPAASRSQSHTPVDSPAPSSQSQAQTQSQSQSQSQSPEPSLPPLSPSRPLSEPIASSPPAQPSKSASRVSQLASSPAMRSPSPLPTSSPVVKPPVSTARNAVIAASDDEDETGDSDDDMGDIMDIWNPKRDADASRPAIDASLFETPKAKRIMSNRAHPSPLTIQYKKDTHNFDMKALLADAEQDEATRASYLKNREEAAAQAEARAAEKVKKGAVMDVIAQTGGENAHKVFRAMERSQPGQGALRYCFFESKTNFKESVAKPSIKVATGPWKLLIQGPVSKREQYLVSGMPFTILKKTRKLPEELFDWMLSDVCVTSSRLLQIEHSKLINLCPEHINARVTIERLEELFSLLGAAEEFREEGGTLALSRPSEDPYMEKDWSNLRAFLGLLQAMVDPMPVDSVAYAAHTLLKMSMDRFVLSSMDVMVDYQKAIGALLDALPALAWGSFCAKASQRLHESFTSQSIRTNALRCLPISSERTHDLRRRLAITFFYDDPSLGAQHPDKVVTIPRITNRLRGETFDITPDTDFSELRSAIFMLDIAADDGGWVATPNREDQERFNNEVDELAEALRGISRRINDGGGRTAQSNVKGVFEWAEKRMLYQVRAKPRPKMDIFGIVEAKTDRNLPKQQNYMRSFLGRPVGGTTPQDTDGA